VLLALFSDYFRRFLGGGMRESYEQEVVINDVSYETFYSLLELLYRSRPWLTEAQQGDVVFLLGLLRAADQFCIDCIKAMCERHLSSLVDADTVDGMLAEAEAVQATQLKLHCEWFKRQQQFVVSQNEPGGGHSMASPKAALSPTASGSTPLSSAAGNAIAEASESAPGSWAAGFSRMRILPPSPSPTTTPTRFATFS